MSTETVRAHPHSAQRRVARRLADFPHADLQVAALLEEAGCVADSASYSMLLKAACQQGNSGAALQILDTMEELQLPPQLVAVNQVGQARREHGNVRMSLGGLSEWRSA